MNGFNEGAAGHAGHAAKVAHWAGRAHFTALHIGFGDGRQFLATWAAWRADPRACQRLRFVALEQQPLDRHALAAQLQNSPWPGLAAQLLAAWPPTTPDLHLLDFEGGHVRLMLALGSLAAQGATALAFQADAVVLHRAACAHWTADDAKALGRRVHPGATLQAEAAAPAVQTGLKAAGFVWADAAGSSPDAAEGPLSAVFAPRFAQGAAPLESDTPAAGKPARQEAVVLGAGLAGAAVALALAREGWQVLVLDRQTEPAAETSGNPGGLFHGTAHAEDGTHARLLRAAALHCTQQLRPLIEAGLPGQLQGLLRLGADTETAADDHAVDDMQAGAPSGQAEATGSTQGPAVGTTAWPAEWLQTLSQAEAGQLAGLPLPSAATLYPGGGWVSPAALVPAWLQHPRIRFEGGQAVQRLLAAGQGWQLLDAQGQCLAETPVLVLASAFDTLRLLEGDGQQPGALPAGTRLHWPLGRQRGQISGWRGALTDSGQPAAALPLQLPLAGGGYALPLPDGLLCGATAQRGDLDPATRPADAQHNWQRLHAMTGLRPPAQAREWLGRVGWRVVSGDRLPVAGPVPLGTVPRFATQGKAWARAPGLFVCTALGGRGITLAPLLGQLLAAQITGRPLPLPQKLVDAVDPARWLVRQARQGGQGGQGRQRHPTARRGSRGPNPQTAQATSPQAEAEGDGDGDGPADHSAATPTKKPTPG